MKLPKMSKQHKSISIMIDRLTKYTHLLFVREFYLMDRWIQLYIDEIIVLTLVYHRDSKFSSKFWTTYTVEHLFNLKKN